MEEEHSLLVCYVDDEDGKGYRGSCSCEVEWESTLCGKVEFIGAEFDAHVNNELEFDSEAYDYEVFEGLENSSV